MRGYSLLRRLKRDQSKCPLYGIAGCPLFRGCFTIGVYGATIRTWVSVRYNGGVRSSGVSVKRGSTVLNSGPTANVHIMNTMTYAIKIGYCHKTPATEIHVSALSLVV